MWTFLIIFVISLVVAYALAPRAAEVQTPGVGEVSVPQVSEDTPLNVVFGTVRIDGPNIVWYGDLDYEAVKKSGGK